MHGAEGEGGEEVVSREQRQQQRGQGGTARGQELVLIDAYDYVLSA